MKEKVGYGIFIGTTAPQFMQIAEEKKIPHEKAESMQEAVQRAYTHAKEKGIQVVIMSPGCASFDMFKDYLDRAHQYIDAVKAL